MATHTLVRDTEHAAQTTLLSTLSVRDSLCALDAASVQEVIRVESLTQVRHAPETVAGVMNLRGKIVTLLDLGRILGFGASQITRESRVYILEDRNEFLGLLVDRVGEVIEMDPDDAEPIPINLPASRARFFQAVCRAGGHVIGILNPAEVLSEAA